MKSTPRQLAQMKAWRDKKRGAPPRVRGSYKKERSAYGYRNKSHRRPGGNKRDSVLTLIYVIEAGPYVKVGIAENLKTRLVLFKTHCPLPVRVVFHSKKMLRTEARSIEVDCHAHLIEHHVHGEWFEVAASKAVLFLQGACEEGPQISPVQLRLVG